MVTKRIPPEIRFYSHVVEGEVPDYAPELGPCLLWTGHAPRYGHFVVETTRTPVRKQAHVYAYELVHGPVKKGLVLDHLCRVKRCVRVSHLEPVTNRENTLRGVSRVAQQARQTHCKRGHPLEGDNLLVGKTRYGFPERRCRECRRATGRRLRAIWRAKQRLLREKPKVGTNTMA